MGSILDAANVSASQDKFLIGKLPTKSGEVSVMTLLELRKALNDSIITLSDMVFDPTGGFNTSTYYIYAINDTSGTNDALAKSTLNNLQEVGISWYRELNKHTTSNKHWKVGNHKVFGGPLARVFCPSEMRTPAGRIELGDSNYVFEWHYSEIYEKTGRSTFSYYWYTHVPGSVYVAVVRAI